MKAPALAAIVAAVCLLGAPLARAQEEPDQKPDLEKAKQHYQSGEQAAAKEDWKTAAREFLLAYEITKDPVLFYKIANSHDRAGDCEAAITYYRRYVEEAPPEKVEPFKARTESYIKACEEKLAAAEEETGAEADPGAEPATGTGPDADGEAQPGAEAGGFDSGSPFEGGAGDDLEGETAPPPPAFLDEEPSWQRSAAWASVGGVIAFGTIGAVLALSAESREEDIENLTEFRDSNGRPATYTGNTQARYDDLVEEGESLGRYSIVAFAAAGAAAGAAAVFFVLDATRPEEPTDTSARIAPAVGAGGLGVQARWRFW